MKNRRKFSRIPMGLAEAIVSFNNKPQSGSLVDESINGIRVTRLHLFNLSAGQRAKIQFRGDSFTGFARTLKREDDGTFSVGFERTTRSSEENDPKAMLLNCYLKNANIEVACIPLNRQNDKIKIRLWNGKEILADESELVCKTRVERFSELRTIHNLNDLVEMYGISCVGMTCSKLELIFDYEFGQLEDCPTKSGGTLV